MRENFFHELERNFPHLELTSQLENMRAWLVQNPRPYLANAEGFIRRWLEKQRKPTPYEARKMEEDRFQKILLERNERWAANA